MHHRLADWAALRALAQTLNQTLDLRTALEAALGHILELTGLEAGWIYLRHEGEQFTLAARHRLPPALTYPGLAWQGECACQERCSSGRLGEPTLMACSRLRGATGDKRGLSHHISIALRDNTRVIGILNLATSQWARLEVADQYLVAAIGDLLGTAIARAYLYEEFSVRRVQERRALLSLSQELLVSDDLEPTLQRLTRIGARLLEADACAFVEADEEGGRAILRACYGWTLPSSSPWPITLDDNHPHLWYLPERSAQLPDDALMRLPPLLRQQNFQGHLAAPVELGGAQLGLLLVNTVTPRSFFDSEAELLGLLASQVAQMIDRERLNQEAQARQRLERELDLASEIQASFLPDCCPLIPGLQIEAFYRAARQVGGDFYDFIEVPPTNPGGAARFGIVIADVTDKGVPAALFMALSRTLLRASAIDGRPPVAVMQRANRLILADSRAGLFVTCFYALVDPVSGHVAYANGGHNYPLLYRRAVDQVIPLVAQGIVLGIVPDPHFTPGEITLETGDVLLFYTDGITEAMNLQRELFGDERLAATLRAASHHSPTEIVKAVLNAIQTFVGDTPQADDMTMVVIKRV
ncbi:GAF domain-containing SpoIIE family protein phosphatase [Chloroflexus sp.]|uniref:GAF domain-containing SpoIIE family protein phosphatase n=1 Tax=Chloroflexus sp. TaxID=1904827 RepID=UPI00262F67B3|nr:SpoIIE family protein phosphatase [uncultured Chloroflexus sp.]